MPSWLKQTAAAPCIFHTPSYKTHFRFFLSLFVWLLPQVCFRNEIWLWQFITAKLILWVEQRQARFRRTELKCVRTGTDTHMQTRTHTHNKVPECSVYIIVFEMVMHEPVNQLATDKRAGPCPGNTHTHMHACNTKLPPFCPDLISLNTFSLFFVFFTFYCLLTFLFFSSVFSLFFSVASLIVFGPCIWMSRLITKILFTIV